MDEVDNNNTNQQKAYIWINSSLGAIPGTGTYSNPAPGNPGSNISDALYNVDLGMAQMKKYSKYSVRVAQFQLEANNTAAFGANPVFTELRDELGKRVNAIMVVIKGLPRDQFTTCDDFSVRPANAALPVGADVAVRQDALDNVFLVSDAGGIPNGYCAVERPRAPQFVVTKQIFGPMQLRVEIRDAGSTRLVAGGWAGLPVGINYRSLPPFNLCLEIEGIAGYEEFPVLKPQIQPNLTNGIGTGNQFGFTDGDKRGTKKKPTGGKSLIGY